MPRFYNSMADAQTGIRGYRARAAFWDAQREAKQAEVNSAEALARAAHMSAIREGSRLRDVVVAAEDHLGMLHAKLTAARRKADHMAESAYLSGDITADAAKVKRQLDGLPALISRAEQELATARDALAAHHTRTAATSTVDSVPSDPSPEVEPVEVEAVEVKRGPGRPRRAGA